jgi:hypothetical protein
MEEPVSPKWHYQWTDDWDNLSAYLQRGWEPFAVTTDANWKPIYHLRKLVTD